MPTLELLAGLGLPSGFVAMVLIALIFRTAHPKISAWAGVLAVVSVGAYAVIQIAEAATGSDVSIQIDPPDVCAFSQTGHPVDLTITVLREAEPLKTRTISGQSEEAYSSRPLNVRSADGALSVQYGECRVGILGGDHLRAVGWRPAEELGSSQSGRPCFWYTNRVHVGQVQRLGDTDFGTLMIRAKQFTGAGEAVVALELGGHEEPVPAQLSIKNKSLAVQSFAEVPEFYVALREADFEAETPWAAFSVFSLQ